MPKIFISYRREDSEHIVGRIYDRLGPHFGRDNVFMDIDTIPFGVDFRKHLNQAVSQCDVLLAVIDRLWLDVQHRDGPRRGQRRLDDPADFVRIEIEAALARDIPVVPVLVGGGVMPREEDLPNGLKELAYRNAAEVRSGRDFHDHLERLIRGIEHLFRQPEHPAPKTRQAGAVEVVALGGGVEMAFAWCPPGTFLMGSPPSEEERSDDETQHPVTLSKGFWLGVTPVTRGQFSRFVQATGYRTEAETDGGAHYWTGKEWKQDPNKNWRAPGFVQTDEHPVVCVSWNDVVAVSDWVTKQSGHRCRLPTEAEWECACRAGSATPFHFGATISTEQASYDGNYTYSGGKKGVYRKATTPVKSFPANAWGLYDMHGNVWEWCQDWYGPYPNSDIKDPQGADSGAARVLRGGSWYGFPRKCRAANRRRNAPGNRYDNFGCRVVLCLD
jgi:formylglycine-generating enzyme required for sulfatase activity